VASELKPDEKLCPFCAETIKKAAIKCRYCHSELPEGKQDGHSPKLTKPTSIRSTSPDLPAVKESAPAPMKTPAPAAPKFERPEEKATTDNLWQGTRLVPWLLILTLISGGLAGGAWWRAMQTQEATGVITSVTARDAAMEAAAKSMETLLTYNYSTLDQDAANARKVMTKSMAKEYDKTLAETRDKILSEKKRLQAKVLASSIVTATEHKAVALVFLDQLTTLADQPTKASFDQRRVRVTLVRGNGGWLVSKAEGL